MHVRYGGEILCKLQIFKTLCSFFTNIPIQHDFLRQTVAA